MTHDMFFRQRGGTQGLIKDDAVKSAYPSSTISSSGNSGSKDVAQRAAAAKDLLGCDRVRLRTVDFLGCDRERLRTVECVCL